LTQIYAKRYGQTSREQLDILASRLTDIGLDGGWSEMVACLDVANVPGITSSLLTNGTEAFHLVEDWTQKPFAKTAQTALWLISNQMLSTLTTTASLTQKGTEGGGFVGENPLRAALARKRPAEKDAYLAPLLALALIRAIVEGSTKSVKVIGTAVYNYDASSWDKVLFRLPPLELGTIESYLDELDLALNQSFVDMPLRTTDRQFLRVLRETAKIATRFIHQSAQKRLSKVWTNTVTFGSDDDEHESQLATRAIEFRIEPPGIFDAGEPDVFTFADPAESASSIDAGPGITSAQIRANFRSQIENQYFEWHWRSLTRPEISIALHAIWRSLEGPDHKHRVVAGIVLLGIVLGKTPEEASLLLLTDAEESDCISITQKAFIKSVPRPPQSWEPRDAKLHVVRTEDRMSLRLPDALFELALPADLKFHSPAPIWKLCWRSIESCAADLAEWALKNKGYARLTPRRLANVMANRVFEACGRHSVIYWLFKKSNDPPPSGTYYTARTKNFLQKVHFDAWHNLLLDEQIIDKTRPPAEAKGIVGSRLQVPVQEVLHLSTFLSAQVNLKGTNLDSIIEHHNGFTAYSLTLLLYATGHRPVSDPFDTLSSISVELGYALLSDKHVDTDRSTRLVPLSITASQQMRHYLAHLIALAKVIAPFNLETSVRINHQTENPSARLLPLFFFLEPNGDWISITPTSLATGFPEAWRYPHNAHRHFLASQLSLMEVPEAAINQLLGHVDAGTSSLSGISATSPRQVFNFLSKSVEAILHSVGFRAIPARTQPQLQAHLHTGMGKAPKPALFGVEKREHERQREETKQKAYVKSEVDKIVASVGSNRNITDDVVKKLIQTIKARSITVAFQNDRVRYEALREELLSIKRATNGKFFIPAPRLVLGRGDSFFSTDALTLAKQAQAGENSYASSIENRPTPISDRDDGDSAKVTNGIQACRPSPPILRFVHGVLGLILVSRLTDAGAIANVIKGEYRLHPGAHDLPFIEYAVNTRNIRRIPADLMTANLLIPPLNAAATEDAILALLKTIAADLIPTLRSIRPSKIVAGLCQMVDARNRIELSGQLADYFAGRTKSASLPLEYWYRVEHDVTLRHKDLGNDPLQNVEVSPEPKLGDEWQIPFEAGTDFDGFSKGITKILSHAAERDPNGRKRQARQTFPKQEKARRINELMQRLSKAQPLPPIYQMVGAWIAKLVVDGSVTGQVETSTIRRYWSALNGNILLPAQNLTIDEILSGVLTEVYAQAIDRLEMHQETLRKIIGLFHAFLVNEFHVPEVEWSDVISECYADESDVINARMVSEHMYRAALELLCNDEHTTSMRERHASIVLMALMYRFGLRTFEATGLLVRDVFRHKDCFYFRVANNAYRKIKTDAGIRFVPQIFELTDLEKSAMKTFIAQASALHGSEPQAAIFSDEKAPLLRSMVPRITARVANAIACVTGTKTFSLYSLRHSFASRLHEECALHVHRMAEGPLANIHSSHSERPNWLTAILVGHTHPVTTLKHYCHSWDRIILQSKLLPESTPARALWVTRGRFSVREDEASAKPAWGKFAELTVPWLPVPLPRPRLKPAISTGRFELAVRFLSLIDAGYCAGQLSALLQCDQHLVDEMLERVQFLKKTRAIDLICGAGKEKGQADFSQRRTNPWKNLEVAAAALDKAYSGDESLAHSLATLSYGWYEYVVPGGVDILLSPIEHLRDLDRLLKSINIPRPDVRIYLSPVDVSEGWFQDALKKASEIGFSAEKKPRLPRPAAQVGRRHLLPRCGVSVRREKNGNVRNTAQLARLLTAIWLASRHETRGDS